jgi:hypothetical protein
MLWKPLIDVFLIISARLCISWFNWKFFDKFFSYIWREVLHKLNHFNGGKKKRKKGMGLNAGFCFWHTFDVRSDRVNGDWHRTKYIITATVDATYSSWYEHAIVFHTPCNGEIAVHSLQRVFQIKVRIITYVSSFDRGICPYILFLWRM